MTRSQWKIITVVLAVGLVGGFLAWFVVFSPSAEQLTQRADAAIQAEDYRLAESLSRIALAQSPNYAPAAELNALAHIELHDYSAARQRVAAFQAGNPDEGAEQKLLFLVSQEFFQHGRLSDTVKYLPAATDDSLFTRIVIARLNGDRAALREMLQEPASPASTLSLLLANLLPMPREEHRDLLETGIEPAPADAKALTGLALLAAQAGDETDAEKLSAEALKIDPNLATPLGIRANLLATKASESEWRIFVLRLPTATLNEPEIWRAFGRRCEETDLKEEAIRCYYEAIAHGADSPQPYESLRQKLVEAENDELADVVQQASDSLAEALALGAKLRQAEIAIIENDSENATHAATISNRLAELGRAQEAAAWRNLFDSSKAEQSPADAEPLIEKLKPLAEYPIPQWLARRLEQRRRESETNVESAESDG